MGILDFYDGPYDKLLIKEALQYYYYKYNDWNVLESEFKNKIDESRSWSDIEVHECVLSLKSLIERYTNSFEGIYLKSDAWFSPDISNLKFWKYYLETMYEQNWPKERITTTTRQCSEIVNFLPNPKNKVLNGNYKDFCKKGLVYGDVQAGKTASMQGLISMYASSGCQFIIVLSGVTNNLRDQTQNRFIKDLKIRNNPSWTLLTPEKDQIFNNFPYVESLLSNGNVCIGVFKKNPHALNSLINYCNEISDKTIWDKYQVLIIDDECDQYSPNVVLHDDDTNEDYKHSAINGLIVTLIKMFSRCCYVGYTATPMANFLNEVPSEESLYPKDFIYALDKNENYFGADKIFGTTETSPTLDVINYIDEKDIKQLKDEKATSIPKSLGTAIIYFILATACKYYRGLKDHSSMMIHIDLKINTHLKIEDSVFNYFKNLKDKWNKNDIELVSEMADIWKEESVKNPFSQISQVFPNRNQKDYAVPSFDNLKNEISNVINKLEIIVDNSSRPVSERLSYKDDEKSVYVIIGGNTLSRGLTIEGLVCSYFARNSNTYDTLLQMGRWFGYRIHYEDLPRIWMPDTIVENFKYLTEINDEMREEIANYKFDITPSEFAMRIRTHPRMKITRELAMQAAEYNLINFSGTKTETLYFERFDTSILNSNIKHTNDFINSLSKPNLKNDSFIYNDCNVEKIIEYIKKYSFASRNKTCNKNEILKFITKANEKGCLLNWNVALRSSSQGIPFEIGNQKIGLIKRSRIQEFGDTSEAPIKVLHAPLDLMADIDYDPNCFKKPKYMEEFKARQDYYIKKGYREKEIPALLVIYPIDKDSNPRKSSIIKEKKYTLTNMEAKQNLIGLMFVFPMISNKEIHQYVSVSLDNSDIEEGDSYND